jgi:GNAT superfamily N-acetyltransferase
MGTATEHRGKGLASLVLSALVEHAREQGAKRVWCYARMGAIGFYERRGWERESDEPIWIEGVGEHRLLSAPP